MKKAQVECRHPTDHVDAALTGAAAQTVVRQVARDHLRGFLTPHNHVSAATLELR